MRGACMVRISDGAEPMTFCDEVQDDLDSKIPHAYRTEPIAGATSTAARGLP